MRRCGEDSVEGIFAVLGELSTVLYSFPQSYPLLVCFLFVKGVPEFRSSQNLSAPVKRET